MVGFTAETGQLPRIDVDDITAGYDAAKPVFAGFSLKIQAPQLVYLGGENGSGKSTFIELLSGYLRPDKGTVRVNGQAASDGKARRQRRICRTKTSLFPSMTVQDHLVFTARVRGVASERALERGKWYGLEQWLDEIADNLSTGNQRKLWYVINTIGDFNVLALDEPFNGLDRESIRKVCDELAGWAERKLIVLVAHQLPEGMVPDKVVDLGRQQAAAASDVQ